MPPTATHTEGPDTATAKSALREIAVDLTQDGPAGPVASVRDLHVTFRRDGSDVRAVRGVSLDVQPGEIVGLVGESGSGKSVLGLSLLGLLPSRPAPIVTGVAEICGVNMVTATSAEQRELRRQHLGAVFQDPMTSLNPTMRIGKQVEEAAGSKTEALRLLDAVGIPQAKERFGAFPHELSGGLRQRVMIALAVAGRPRLVIADEPTTALDVSVQAQILALLRELCDELSVSFLFVTHDLGVASQLADRIVVLYGGLQAEQGAATSVLTAPAHPYTVGLLRSRLTMDTERGRPLSTLPGEPPDPRHHPTGCPFAPRCSLKVGACDEAVPALVAAGTHDGEAACIRAGESPPEPLDERRPWGPVSETLARYGTVKEPAVVLAGATKGFSVRQGFRQAKKLQALRGIDLEIAQGEAVALVGESGSGKSTVLKAIAGLHDIDSGSITLGPGARPQIVFQDAGSSMTPWMTVGDLIVERLRNERAGQREARERMLEALNTVGLPAEVAGAKPAQLSGGQRQRAALARAIVEPPGLLLADEPTSSLDVSLAATALNLLGRLRRELGMALLFVTHDLAAARMVADRVAVMYLGRIVEIGPVDQVTTDPQHPYTKALLGAVPCAGRVHVPLLGDPASPLDPPTGCAFNPRCPEVVEGCDVHEPAMVAPCRRQRDGRLVACVHAAVPEPPAGEMEAAG